MFAFQAFLHTQATAALRTNKQMDKFGKETASKQSNKQTNKQANKQTNKQTNNQTNK